MSTLSVLFIIFIYFVGFFLTYALVLGTFYNIYQRAFRTKRIDYGIALKIAFLSWAGYLAFVILYRKDKEFFSYKLW